VTDEQLLAALELAEEGDRDEDGYLAPESAAAVQRALADDALTEGAIPPLSEFLLLEAGFTGTITAKDGVEYHYVDGVRVKGAENDSAGRSPARTTPTSPEGLRRSEPGNTPAASTATVSAAALPSKAHVVFESGTDAKKGKSRLTSLLGKEASLAEVASYVGAPDDATVTVSLHGKADLKISIEHPAFSEPCIRYIVFTAKGYKPYLKNELIKIKPLHQGQGLGTQIFSRQIEQAAASDKFTHVECHAARWDASGNDTFNGYYTWAVMGYQAYFSDMEGTTDPKQKQMLRQLEQDHPGVESLLELVATPEGREWWKKHGCDVYDAKFVLKKDSPSLQHLRKYLEGAAAKRATKSAPTSSPGD
jgi:GNAT superfamily N-acetyltransferase